ncbi:MAG: hypothetical protein ACREM9_10070 [Gemmatimonadales bacterium]
MEDGLTTTALTSARHVGIVLGAMAQAFVTGCQSRAATPAGDLARYHLSAAPDSRITLPAELREVSGLAAAPDGRLFAHGDEEGTLFELDPGSGKVLERFSLEPGATPVDPGKKPKEGQVTGDFEDLAIVGDRFFLVTSTGVLVEFHEGENGAKVPFTTHPTTLGDTCEVEGLAYDSASESLLLLCKQMTEKTQRDRVEVHAWSLREQRIESHPRWAVPFSALAPVTGGKAFNGSALALVPGSASIVVVAGPQRLFAEIGADGQPVAGGELSRAALPQPEGIAFLPDGTLLVSSEGGKGEAAIAAYRP